MTKRKTEFTCKGCGNGFASERSHDAYCSLECACWSRIEVRGEGECWPWLAGKTNFGYGKFRYARTWHYSHKVAYESRVGPTNGLQGCHECDNPSCCNPSHIFLGTQSDNMADMRAKGRHTPDYAKGSRCYLAKLDEAAVLALRADKARGLATMALMDKYSTSRSNVKRLVRRLTWRHV